MKKQEAAAAVIDTLAEKWPNAFFADPQKRRPLKVGVHLDILEALPGVNKKTLSAALRFYTRHPCYVQAVVKGQARVDLSGVEVGPVSERDREMAAAELRNWAPKQEREAEARRAADEKYRPNRRQCRETKTIAAESHAVVSAARGFPTSPVPPRGAEALGRAAPTRTCAGGGRKAPAEAVRLLAWHGML
jgi:sRNA-binding protein